VDQIKYQSGYWFGRQQGNGWGKLKPGTQNAHACRFLYFKYVLLAGPISTSSGYTTRRWVGYR